MEEIGDFMSSPVLRIDSGASAQDAAIMMEVDKVGSLIVENLGEDVGILTEKDLARKVIAKNLNPESVTVDEIMTQPIISMDRYLPIEEANLFMREKGIRHLAITEENKIVGVLSVRDLVGYYSRDFRMQE